MRRMTLLAVCLLVLFLAAPVGAAETRIPLHGRITGPGGDPLPGARAVLVPVVSFHEYGRLVLEGRTNPEPVAGVAADADGAFHLAAPEPGMWKVLVEAKGFVPAEVPLEPLLVETDLMVKLARDAGVRVRVTGPDGRPLAGARVRVEDANPRFLRPLPHRTPVRIALTDETGLAVLPRASGETVHVRAGAPGYPVVEVKDVRGDTATVRLAPGKTREIEVRDAANKPVPEVVVRLGQGAWAVGRTSDAGLLAVAFAEGGERGLVLTTEDGRWLEAFVLPPGPKEKGPQKLRLAAPEMLPGRVVSAVDGRPLPGALVWRSGDAGAFRKTGVTGDFQLPVAPDRQVEVSAAVAGFFQGDAEVGSRPGRPRRPPTLALEPAMVVSGRVVDERGQGVAGVEIRTAPQMGGRSNLSQIRRIGRSNSSGMLRTDGSGRFRLSGLGSGLGYTLRLTRSGFAPLRAEIPPLEPGRPGSELQLVMLQGRTAFGRVLGPSEAPVAGARVTLRSAASTDPRARMRQMFQPEAGYEAATGEGGRFELTDLPAGSFDLEVRGRGYAPLTVPGLAVPEGKGRTDLGTVVLAPGVTLEGYAVDPNGQPVAGAEVRANATQSEPFAMPILDPGEAAAVTGADGSFRIEDRRAAETLDLQVTREGYAPGHLPGVRVPTEQPLRVTLQPASAILGKVIDPDGKPVPNARVWAVAMDEARGMRPMVPGRFNQAITDEQGAFRLAGVSPGATELHAMAQGWQPAELSNLEVPAGRDLKGVEVVLQPGATVEGRILSPAGQPVPGAGVSVLKTGEAAMIRFFRPDATADGEGWYLMEGVAPGPHSVAAEHPSYRRAVRDLDVKMGENTLDLTLEGGAEVSGRVVDDAGAPVAGARILLLEGGRSWNLPEGASGADGAFEIAGVPDGDYRLSADKEGFARDREGDLVKVAGAPVAGLEVRLSRGGSIVGQISGLDLADLARVRVAADVMGRFGEVTPEGGYRIDHLEPGEWTITASVPGTPLHAEGRATLEPGASETRLDLEFGGGLTLSGRLVRNGAPVRGQSLTLQGNASEMRWGETDHDGRFRFDGLEKGSYELELTSFRGGLRHQEDVEMTDDREVLIELNTVTVSGRVLDGVDSSPIAGATVTLLPGADLRDSSFPPEVRTDSRGAFRLPDVSEGDWTVRAVAEGYGPVEMSLAVAGTPMDDLDLTLQATEGVSFEVVLPSGRPPDQVQLAVLDAAGKAVASGSYPVGENGRVRVSTIPAGTWELLLDSPGAAPTSVSITAPGNAGRVILPPAGGLRIQVPGLSGARTAATVALTGAGGRPFRALEWSGGVKTSFELDSGSRRFERLPPGVWEVRVTAADGRTWTGKANVAPGVTAEVVLE